MPSDPLACRCAVAVHFELVKNFRCPSNQPWTHRASSPELSFDPHLEEMFERRKLAQLCTDCPLHLAVALEHFTGELIGIVSPCLATAMARRKATMESS